MKKLYPLLVLLLTPPVTVPTSAQEPGCHPCAGVRVADPTAVAEALVREPPLEEGAVLYVGWRVDLEAPAAASVMPAVTAVRGSGATPWLSMVFRTPRPLKERQDRLNGELRQVTELVRQTEGPVHYQVLWHPMGEGSDFVADPGEYAYLLKRAAVAISGAEATALVVTAPLPPDPDYLSRLYGEDVAAYVDAVALAWAPAEELSRAVEVLAELDPGRSVVLDSMPEPEDPLNVLTTAAANAALGIAITLFDLSPPSAREARDAALATLKTLAREFRGDLSLDPYSAPSGVDEAWSFVRGSDLGLRVIARAPAGAESLTLRFPDPQLSSPARVHPATGEVIPQYDVRRRRDSTEVEIADPPSVVLLQVERAATQALDGVEGVEERLTVEEIRQIPVEEILRRLQAFEDAQSRRLEHYRAINTSHLRFELGTGVQNLEVTYRGDFFFRQGRGFDWAWDEFYVNGVKWRGKSVPKIPLIQPEKAAALPLEIHFTREYRYRLRNTARVGGRNCWVVDFEPTDLAPGRSLYKGTVWIDRELYARVRTRAVQLGLEGEVISNEETIHYSPVDSNGAPAAWEAESYWLPLRIVGQQLLSILNTTTVVEREILLSDVLINGETFAERREEVLASDVTMLRDTEQGLRYLVQDKDSGARVVQEELQPNRLFGVAGAFFDRSFDFPIPLAGIDYFSFDFRESGNQVNLFFAGVLLMADIANPNLFGSRFDAGADLFAIGIPGQNTLFRNNQEVEEEEVEVLSPNLELSLGRPLGQFAKLDLEYGLDFSDFSRSDTTAPDFVLPSDHLEHRFTLTARYNRSGFRSRLWGSYHRRSEWEEWGLKGNSDFNPEAKDYTRYGAALAKIWHLKYFQKVGAEIEYVDGDDLDRFSKYEFGFFSDTRVHGYESDRVRASQAWAAHLSYGFDVGQLFRLDLVGDVAWATDEASGLDNELLAGVGLVGTVIGPWQTIVNIDLGAAVDGPDDGFVVFLAFLKLFGSP